MRQKEQMDDDDNDNDADNEENEVELSNEMKQLMAAIKYMNKEHRKREKDREKDQDKRFQQQQDHIVELLTTLKKRDNPGESIPGPDRTTIKTLKTISPTLSR